MNVTRRGVLAAAGAVGVTGLAGCLEGNAVGATGGGDAEGTDGDGGGAGGSTLAYLRVANEDDVAHTVHLLVQRGDEPVHWSAHDLPAGDDEATSRTVEQSWTGAGDEVTVYFRLDDADEWESFDIDDGRGDCYGAMAQVDGDGEFGVWFEKDPPACERTATTTAE